MRKTLLTFAVEKRETRSALELEPICKASARTYKAKIVNCGSLIRNCHEVCVHWLKGMSSCPCTSASVWCSFILSTLAEFLFPRAVTNNLIWLCLSNIHLFEYSRPFLWLIVCLSAKACSTLLLRCTIDYSSTGCCTRCNLHTTPMKSALPFNMIVQTCSWRLV